MKDDDYDDERSTGYKGYYNYEEGQRQYHDLIDENKYLKEQIRRREEHHHKDIVYSPQQLERMSESMCAHRGTTQPPAYLPKPHDHIIIQKVCPYNLGEKGSISAYQLIQQNRYLQQKIEMLKDEYQKQSRRIQHYLAKVQQHNGCKQCYEKRYYELLRITSPQ